ncbi:MAG: hydrogenase, partial [Epsilonproteobacteria bacterium]|nr:hydrogenase [Campylobacterota bacterium]
MNLNATYSSTSGTTYSAKSAVTLSEVQEKNLSAKEIVNGYITQYMEEALLEAKKSFSTQADTFRLADIGYTGKPLSELSQSEASELVSEDGFFGIAQTSERIAN